LGLTSGGQFYPESRRGEDVADYKETLILGKEVMAKMVELGTRKLANSLA